MPKIAIGRLISILLLVLVMPMAAVSANEVSKYLGRKTTPVPVVGTGSMYPSLYWVKTEGGPDDESITPTSEYRTTPNMYHYFHGFNLLGREFLHRKISSGDMVSFRNDKTQEILANEGKDTSAGFIKRVIAVPGETLELRDGFVYKNGSIIEEPYIYKPRSTYGDIGLPDCTKLEVPEGHYFVMGDNRKTSADSRGELGLISDQDISYVLPFEEQGIYHSLWRDTSKDDTLLGKPTLDTREFLTLLNKERIKEGAPALELNTKLSSSSQIMGKKRLLGQNNFSLQDSLKTAGYSNILSGQFISRGHFSSTELLQNLLFFGDTKAVVLDLKMQEIGVATVNLEVDGCPRQIIVGQLGGYIQATYDQEVVQSWGELLHNLDQVIPSWQKAQDYDFVDKSKLQELLNLLSKRRALAAEVVQVMQNREWLSDTLKTRMDNDKVDAQRAEELITEINNSIKNQ